MTPSWRSGRISASGASGAATYGSGRLWGWAMYDFANSAFATTVLAVVFNVYFAKVVVPPEGVVLFGRAVGGPALWSFMVSASMAVLFFLSPLLGAVADLAGRRKTFLTFFWLTGALGTMGLAWAEPGAVGRTAVFFLVANIGFAAGNVFYNAFLPDLGPKPQLGRISGFGWAVGYLGGGACLALNLAMIQAPQWFGLSRDNHWPVRASFLSVGIWWLVFGLPFVWKGPPDRPAPRQSLWRWARQGWGRLWGTFREFRRYKNLGLFILAYALYNDGIETVILTASIVGATLLGMPQGELVQCFLMIQGVAFLGAVIFGRLADRWRHKPTILLTLGVFTGVVVWGAFIWRPSDFWALGAVLGLVLGGSQAASRSLMGLLTPPERAGEFFGFYGVIGKLTALFGPLVFGLVTEWAGIRVGIMSLAFFFIAGAAVLLFVREPASAA